MLCRWNSEKRKVTGPLGQKAIQVNEVTEDVLRGTVGQLAELVPSFAKCSSCVPNSAVNQSRPLVC